MSQIFLSLILVLGALLRFYNNTGIALWHDEAFSALFLRYPWAEMMSRIGLDVHPPLYYIILRVWSIFAGTSLLSLRLLSIIFGVLTIWAGYLFVKTAFQNRRLALAAALLLGINPFQIQYALEARMYTLGTFLILWSSYFLVKALAANQSAGSKKYWVGFALVTAAGLYTHYYLLFSIAAQGLFVLLYALKHKKFQPLLWATVSFAASLILFIPWLKTFLAQLSRVEKSYWIPSMDRWSVPGTIWKMIFGGQGIRHSILIVASIAAALILIYFVRRVNNFTKWLIILQVVVPITAAIVLSLKTNIYLDRYFVFASLFFSILVTSTFYHIPKFVFRWILIISLILGSFWAFFKNWSDLNIAGKPGMAGAAGFINESVKPGDKIYVGSSFIFFTFKYYNQTAIKPLLYSTEPVEKIPHFSGTALLTNNDLVLGFGQEKKNDTVWLLWTTGFGGAKTKVPGNWKQLKEKGYEDSPGFKGTIFVTEYRVN